VELDVEGIDDTGLTEEEEEEDEDDNAGVCDGVDKPIFVRD
jgi:hypothetical protein